MRFVVVISLCLVLIITGCAQNNKQAGNFQSEEYGFSFDFPPEWNEVTKDLPNQWAIVNGQNTVIFTVNDAQLQDLLALGKIQAIRDSQTEPGKVPDEVISQVDQMVHISQFGGVDWYTYAIEFSEKNVNSVISGTICGSKEINIVLVSSIPEFEQNRQLYIDMLNSFSC